MKHKYLSLIPKPFLDDIIANRVIPFVGAGFSKNATIPDGLNMPDWNELGKIVASEINNYVYDNNPIDTLSYYEALYSRNKLVELLINALHEGKVTPSKTYQSFCRLFNSIICTTNFDSLIEDQFTLMSYPVSVIATNDRLTIDNSGECKVIKLHGDFNHPDKMVITEDDYDTFIDKNPILCTYIANLFITKTMFLVGYSFDDNDFRSIWKIINSRLGSMSQPAYCVTVGLSRDKIEKFRRRNIKVINIEGNPKDYKTILDEFFSEIYDYIQKAREKLAIGGSDKINEQMHIPAENNKMCFICCAYLRTSQILSITKPIFEKFGITALSLDNINIPGNSFLSSITTAIRKSRCVIVDIGSNNPNEMMELGIILSEKGLNNVLILHDKKTPVPLNLLEIPCVDYENDLLDPINYENIAENIYSWISSIFSSNSETMDNKDIFIEAKKYYISGEYSICIVLAYSTLESYILDHFNDSWTKDYGPTPRIFYLSDKAMGHYEIIAPGGFPSPNHEKVKEQIALRNKIVNSNYIASKKEAKSFLSFVEMVKSAIDKESNET